VRLRSPRPTARRALLLGLAIACLLPVSALAGQPRLSAPHPGFNQAYRIGEDAWGNCTLGSGGCSDRLSATGCLVGAMAAVLDYYNVQLDVPAAESCLRVDRRGMDPGILNDWLRIHDGFGVCGTDPTGGACCLEWSSLPAVSMEFHSNAFDVGLDPRSEARIDAALAAGYPVVAGVHWAASCGGGRGSEDCHWVVITGKRLDTYVIIDPFNPDFEESHGVRTTLDRGVRGAYTIDRFAVANGPVAEVTVPTVELEVDGGRQPDRFRPQDLLELSVTVRDARIPLATYVRVIDPQGSRRFVIRPSGGVAITLDVPVDDRTTFHDAPRSFPEAPEEWLALRLDGAATGTWRFEVWLEDPLHPGAVVAQARSAFTVGEIQQTAPLALLGLLLAVAVAILVLAAQNRP